MSNSLDPDQVRHFVRAGLSVPILRLSSAHQQKSRDKNLEKVVKK